MAKKMRTTTVASLPQVKREVWEVGRRDIGALSTAFEGQGELPELLLAVQPGAQGGVVRCDVVPSSTPATALVDFAMQAMAAPLIGKPRRPQAVRVASADEATALVEALGAVGVWLEVSSRLATLDSLHQHMGLTSSGLTGDYRTQARQAGTTLRQEELYEVFRTARAFHRAQLWLDFGDEALLEILLQPAIGAPKMLYGILMGSMEQEYGLALFTSREALQQFYELSTQHIDQLTQPAARSTREFDSRAYQEEGQVLAQFLSVPSISLTFTPQPEVPPSLLEEAKYFKLPIANKSAFPLIIRTGHGQMQIGTAADLHDVLWAMRAILDWDRQLGEMDVDTEVDVTITSKLEGVANVLPPVTAHTTLRLNPCVPDASDELLLPELNTLLSELLVDRSRSKSRAPAKPGKTAASRTKKATTKKPALKAKASKPPRMAEKPRPSRPPNSGGEEV